MINRKLLLLLLNQFFFKFENITDVKNIHKLIEIESNIVYEIMKLKGMEVPQRYPRKGNPAHFIKEKHGGII